MLSQLVIVPLLRALSWLAIDTASRVGGSLGVLTFYLGVRRRVASAVMGEALGVRGSHRRDLVRRSYASMGASFIELWTFGGVDGGEKHVRAANPLWFQQTLSRYPGCVFLTPHLGNWELGAHGVARLVPHFMAYAKAQHNPVVDAAANAQRKFVQLDMLMTQHGDRTSAVKVMRALRSGACVGLMADQGPPPEEGARAVFMGVETYCHAGPGFFAKRTNTPIIPGLCVRVRAGEFIVFMGRPLPSSAGDESALVQASMDLLATMIAAFPGQYFWQHKRFKNHLGRAQRSVEPWKLHGFSLLGNPLQALPPSIAAVSSTDKPSASPT